MITKIVNLKEDGSVYVSAYLHEFNREFASIEKRPAIIVLGGGGYYGCSYREAESVALAYLAEGYHVFRLNYSCYPAVYPAQLIEAQETMRIIIDNAKEWMVDIDKIAVAGFSAGGHLALGLGTGDKYRPSAMILGYPVVLDGTCDVMAGSVPSMNEKVDKLVPPTFVFSTYDDELVPIRNTIELMSALDKNNVPFESHIFSTGHHGLALAKPLSSNGASSLVQEDVAQWFALSVKWLKKLWGEFEHDRKPLVVAESDYINYSLDVFLSEVWGNESCKKIMKEALVSLTEEMVQAVIPYRMTVRGFLYNAPFPVTGEQLTVIEEKLKQIKA